MKMQTKTISLLLFAAVLFSTTIAGCKKEIDPLTKEPKACIVSQDSVFVGTDLSVSASCAEGAITYLWNFGDGTTATTAAASHKYMVGGSFTITLTVTNTKGTSTTTKTVYVKECNYGFGGSNCNIEVRNQFLGTYIASGTASFTGGSSSLSGIIVTVTKSSQGFAYLHFNIDYGSGVSDTMTGMLDFNDGSLFNFPSQIVSPGYISKGYSYFSNSAVSIFNDQTNTSNGNKIEIVLAGPKQ